LQAQWTTRLLTLTVYLASFAIGQLIYGPLSDHFGRRRESGATYCAASGGRSSITLIEAITKPARDDTREPSLALKGRLKLTTRSSSRFAAAEVSYQGYGPRVVPAEMR
jgi:hypothetical protein